ncbi:MAG: pyruvate kinase alpha/beta domain-containing protein, partial [Angelakisella sp.]
ARMISKYRPAVPIIACTSNEYTYRQLALSWGVVPVMIPELDNTDVLLEGAIQGALEQSGLIKDGDLVVLTAGIPVGMSGTTNLLKVQTVGTSLVSGTGLNTLSTAGTVCIARSNEELFANFNFGDILVCNDTCDLWLKMLEHASGIIAEQGGNSHLSGIADQLGIPVMCGAHDCCRILKSGMSVVMDAKRGVVSSIASV